MVRIIKIIMAALVVAGGLTASGCSGGNDTGPAPAIDLPAPDFELQSPDGHSFSLGGLRGRAVLLNFWATWCGPCRMEMPYIQEVFEDADWGEQGLMILAVNVGESPEKIKSFMEEDGLSFTVLMDRDQSVARAYNVRGIPATYFIDKNGIIKDIKVGTFRNKAEIDWRLVNSILEDV